MKVSKISNRIWAGGAVLIMALVLVFFVGFNRPLTHSTPTVSIGTFSRTITYGTLYVAQENGWLDEVFRKYDMNYSFTEFQTLPSINEAIASNKLDLVLEAEIPASIGRAAGVDEKIVGINASYYQQLVLPSNSSIQSYADLAGKRIAVQSGTSSHYSLSKMLELAHLSRSDVQMIDMAPADGKAAFDSNQVDAWAVWPPFVEQEELSGNVKTLRGTDILSVVVVRGEFIRQNPGLEHDILAVLDRAKKWIVDHPEEAKQIIAKRVNLPLEVVNQAWPKHNFEATLGPSEIADIQAKADFLFQAGLIKNKVDVAKDLVQIEILG